MASDIVSTQANKKVITAGAGSALNDTPISAIEVGDYQSVSVQLTGTWVATVTFEGSNDNANWVSILLSQEGVAAASSATTTGNGVFSGAFTMRYFRARVSAYTSGSLVGTALFHLGSITSTQLDVANVVVEAGNLTNNNAAPAATNVGSLDAIANASAPTWTEGRQVLLSTDLSGNLRTTTTLAANQSVNVAQINGVTATMGNGISGTGVLRVTIASDSTGQIALAAGAAIIGSLTANQSVNVAQINGVTPLMGNGITGTGSQRVTIASDNTAFSVNATLSAETTKVIGTVNIASAQTLATVTTVSAVTAITNALPAGANLIGKVGLDQTTPGTTNAMSLAQIGATTVVNGGLAGSLAVGGTVANNGTITANPLNLGVQAVSSENTAVTTAKQVQLVADLVGKLIVLPYANPENFVNGTTAAIVDTTTTSVIASAGGSLRNYITSIIVSNSHATVGTFVKITDGASTILWEGYAAPAGGGFTQSFPVPLRGTAATAVNAICVTTGANVIVSCAGYKGV